MKIFSDPAFIINFISTFGLATFIVIYFILIRDPKRDKAMQKRDEELITLLKEKYKILADDYDELAKSYDKLQSNLDPQKREMSHPQSRELCHVALDRDLYKLYYHLSRKIDGDNNTLDSYMVDTIMLTKTLWNEFNPPFPKIKHIDELYGLYSDSGKQLKEELKLILDSDESQEKKKDKIWNKLKENTINMKSEFNDCLRKVQEGEKVDKWITIQGQKDELNSSPKSSQPV